MARWTEEQVPYDPPAPSSRWRDVVVMATFSMLALGAAFAVVQLKYADGGTATGTVADAPTEVAALDRGLADADGARRSVDAEAEPAAAASEPARDLQVRLVTEARAEVAELRGELEAALARIGRLERAVGRLQATAAAEPLPAPGAAATDPAPPDMAALSEGRQTVDGSSVPKAVAPVRPEPATETAAGGRWTHAVRDGDTLGGIADEHCLLLEDLRRLNPDIGDPNALRVDQILTVEDRCPVDAKAEAVTD